MTQIHLFSWLIELLFQKEWWWGCSIYFSFSGPAKFCAIRSLRGPLCLTPSFSVTGEDEYWALIGQYWSRDLNTELWLVNTEHVTWILTCDWLILQVSRDGHGAGQGHGDLRGQGTDPYSQDRWALIWCNTGPDWSRLITWSEFLNTNIWLARGQPRPGLWHREAPRLQVLTAHAGEMENLVLDLIDFWFCWRWRHVRPFLKNTNISSPPF